MTYDEIQQALIDALQHVYERDRQLIDMGAHERSLTHRLAFYLEIGGEFEGWNIDCEYNREAAAGLPKTKTSPKTDLQGGRVLPDIIVHHRAQRGPAHNLLILEAKTKDQERAVSSDLRKLATTQQAHCYQYKAFVTFQPMQLWLAGGQAFGDGPAWRLDATD